MVQRQEAAQCTDGRIILKVREPLHGVAPVITVEGRELTYEEHLIELLAAPGFEADSCRRSEALGKFRELLREFGLDHTVMFDDVRFDFEVTMDWNWDKGNANMDRTHALPDTSGRVVMIEREGARLELFQYRTPSPNPADPERRNVDHGISHLCFEYDDVEAARQTAYILREAYELDSSIQVLDPGTEK